MWIKTQPQSRESVVCAWCWELQRPEPTGKMVTIHPSRQCAL